MMKKITTLVLAVLGVFALGTLTSCKDDCEDRVNDLRSELLNQNSTLRELLEAQKSDLQGQINVLKEQLNNINSCSCDPEEFKNISGKLDSLVIIIDRVVDDNIPQQTEQIETISDAVDDLKERIEAIENGHGGGSGDLDAILKSLEDLKKALENKADKAELEKVKEALESSIKELVNRVSALEAAKTVIENDIIKINETIKIIQETLNGVPERVENLETTIQTIQTNIITIEEECKAANDLLQKQIDELKDRLKNIGPGGVYDDTAVWNKITDLQNQIDKLKGQGGSGYDDTELNNKITALQNEIENLKNLSATVTSLQETVNNLTTTINNFQTTINNFETRLGTVETDLANASSRILILETWMEQMKGMGGSCNCDIAALKTEIAEVKAYAETIAKQYSNEVKNELIATLNTKISEVTAAYAAADAALKSEITTLGTKVDNIDTRVSAVETEVAKLTGLYNAIVNRLNSQISSIIVQSVTTPLFLDANISLPFNVQSNILCAYYGSIQDVKETWFPSSSDAANLSDPEDILIDDELENFDVDETHYYQGDKLSNTGGKIYLTINPSNVNFTGAGLKLVDSQNGASGFTLDNVKKSNKRLSFVSRAADNGFYEADVTLVDENKAAFPTAPLKEAAKEVYDLVKTHTGVRDMATAVVKAAYKSVNLPAYAVQAPYTYKDEKGSDVTAYVHSNYNILATAIHPLTYNFSGKLGDYASKIPHKKLRHIPYLSKKLQDLSAWGEIKGKLYFEFDDVDYTVKSFSFTIPSFTLDEVNLTVTVEDVKYSYDQPTGYDPVTGQFTGWETKYGYLDITVPITGNELKDIEKAIQDQILTNLKNQFEDLNVKMQDLQVSFVDAINTALENTADMINTRAEEIIDIIESLVQKSDKYVDRINSLIDKVNNQLQKVYTRLDNIDYYLLPIMFYGNKAGDLHHLSSYKSTASYVNAGYMVLYPTSYTAELLNPASKKMIKVTKAERLSDGKNDAAEVAAANKSFDNLDKVIDGSVRSVGVQLKSGYAYEIAYSAMDYTGYQITQRYWVKVK